MKSKFAPLCRLLCVAACLCVAPSVSAQSGYPPSETITYESLRNGTLTLRAFSGRRVRYALPDSWLEGGGSQALTPAELLDLIERTDSLYDRMAAVVGGEPSGQGLLLVAVTPLSTAQDGLAVLGAKRVELAERLRDRVKFNLARQQLNATIIHETAHTFDLYSPYFNYYADAAHAWTEFWEEYAEYLLLTGPYPVAPEMVLQATAANVMRRWDALATLATWARCVRPGTGCESEGIVANRVYAGLLLKYASLHGRAALRRAFEFYRQHRATHSLSEIQNYTAEEKNDLLAEALSFGINADVSGEFDAWFWPVSPAARERLRQTYPVPNPFTQDRDADGWSPVRGDLDDYDAGVYPGAVEIVDGKDNDSNGFIDDVTRTAGPTPFTPPAKLVGRLRPEQSESYRFEGAGEFLLRTRSNREGWFGLVEIRREGDSNNAIFFGIAPNSAISALRLESAGPWMLKVIYNQTSGPEGDYEIVLAPKPTGGTGVGNVFALPLRAANSARERVLAPNGLARAVGTLPGARVTAAEARPDAQGRWPTVLSSIEVRVAGQAATLLAVSTTGGGSYAIDFVVPVSVAPATSGARVPVVVRHTASGAQWRLDTAELSEGAPALWGQPIDGQSFPRALALESPRLLAIDESRRAPADGATRIAIFASGLGTNRTPANTQLLAQLADGSRVTLPVEFVGPTGAPGIEQMVFTVGSALAGQTRVLLSVAGGEETWVSLPLR